MIPTNIPVIYPKIHPIYIYICVYIYMCIYIYIYTNPNISKYIQDIQDKYKTGRPRPGAAQARARPGPSPGQGPSPGEAQARHGQVGPVRCRWAMKRLDDRSYNHDKKARRNHTHQQSICTNACSVLLAFYPPTSPERRACAMPFKSCNPFQSTSQLVNR